MDPTALTNQDLDLLIASIGGIEGASAIGMVIIAVQVFLFAVKTKYGKKLPGPAQFWLVAVLTFVGVFLSRRVQGASRLGATINGIQAVIPQIAAHQAYKQSMPQPKEIQNGSDSK